MAVAAKERGEGRGEGDGGGGIVYLVLPAFFPSLISSFFTQNKTWKDMEIEI